MIEEEKMKKFREDMAKNKGSYDITKLIEDAKKDAKVEVAEELLRNGASVELVLIVTKLPLEIIESLKSKIESER